MRTLTMLGVMICLVVAVYLVNDWDNERKERELAECALFYYTDSFMLTVGVFHYKEEGYPFLSLTIMEYIEQTVDSLKEARK